MISLEDRDRFLKIEMKFQNTIGRIKETQVTKDFQFLLELVKKLILEEEDKKK